MLEVKLKEECDVWMKRIANEVNIPAEKLAYMSIEKFINEYRTRKAIRGYVEGEISLGKSAEVAGMSKRKFMAMIENLGIPFNISAYDLVKGFGVLSELRGNSAGENG
jgi:predicted HTH domain antitoxin